MKITQEQLNKIEEILFDTFGVAGESGHEITRTDYSGRGMYGKTCVGFVVRPRDVAAVGAAIALAFGDDLTPTCTMLERTSQDSMAFDVIVYFPGVTLAEESEEDK